MVAGSGRMNRVVGSGCSVSRKQTLMMCSPMMVNRRLGLMVRTLNTCLVVCRGVNCPCRRLVVVNALVRLVIMVWVK